MGSSLDTVKPFLGPQLENRIRSLLEEFVCKSNSRYAKRFPRFKRLLDAVAAWADGFDLCAKDTSVKREMIKRAIDCLVNNGPVTQFGDPAALNSCTNKMDPDALPDQNALQNVWQFINEKDFWQNQDRVCPSEGQAGNTQADRGMKESSSSDLDVEIGSVSQESSAYNTCRTSSVYYSASQKIENVKSVQVQVCCQDVGCVCELSVKEVFSPRRGTMDCSTNTNWPCSTTNDECICNIKMNNNKCVQTEKYSLVKENIKKFDMNTQCDGDKKMYRTKLVQTQNACVVGRNVNKKDMDTQCDCMARADIKTQVSCLTQNLVTCNTGTQCDCVTEAPVRCFQIQTSSPRRINTNTECDCPASVNCKDSTPVPTSSPDLNFVFDPYQNTLNCLNKEVCDKPKPFPRKLNVNRLDATQYECNAFHRNSKLKVCVHKATSTSCSRLRVPKVSSISLPCKSDQLIVRLFEADPSLSDSCLVLMRKKFEKDINNACSCVNDILRKLGDSMIRQLCLNCDIRSGRVDLNLVCKDKGASKTRWFLARVPTCSNIQKRDSEENSICRCDELFQLNNFSADLSCSNNEMKRNEKVSDQFDPCLARRNHAVDSTYCKGGMKYNEEFKEQLDPVCDRGLRHNYFYKRNLCHDRQERTMDQRTRVCPLKELPVESNFCKTKREEKFEKPTFYPVCSTPDKQSCVKNEVEKERRGEEVSFIWSRNKQMDFVFSSPRNLRSNDDFNFSSEAFVDEENCELCMNNRNLNINREEKIVKEFCRCEETYAKENGIWDRFVIKYPEDEMMDLCDCNCNYSSDSLKENFCQESDSLMGDCYPGQCFCHLICTNNDDLNTRKNVNYEYSPKKECRNFKKDQDTNCIVCRLEQENSSKLEDTVAKTEKNTPGIKYNVQETNNIKWTPKEKNAQEIKYNVQETNSIKLKPKEKNAMEIKHNAQETNNIKLKPKEKNATEIKHNAQETNNIKWTPKEKNATEVKHNVQETNNIKWTPKEKNGTEIKHNVQQTNSIKLKITAKTEKRVSIVEHTTQGINNTKSKSILKTDENVSTVEYNVQGTNTSGLVTEDKASGGERDNFVAKNVTFQEENNSELQATSFYLKEKDVEEKYSVDSISPPYPNSDNSFDGKCSYCGADLSNPVFDENINTENGNSAKPPLASEKPVNKRQTYDPVPKDSLILNSEELKDKLSNVDEKSSVPSVHDQSTNIDSELKVEAEKMPGTTEENTTACKCIRESEFIKIPPGSIIENDNSSITESLFVFCRSPMKPPSVSDFSTEDESSSSKNFESRDCGVRRKVTCRRVITPKRKRSTVCPPYCSMRDIPRRNVCRTEQRHKNRLLRESNVASRLCDSFPAINRIKYLIRKKLGKLLLEERDKGTCTSKTFLRNDRYLVSVSSGKLNEGRMMRDSCSVDSSSRCPFTARNRYEPRAALEKTFTEGCELKKYRNAFSDIKTRCRRMIRSNDLVKKIGANGAAVCPGERYGSKSTDTQDLIGKNKLKTRNRESRLIDPTVCSNRSRSHLSILSMNSGKIIFIEDHGDHSSNRKLCHKKNRTSKEDKKPSFDSTLGRNHCKRSLESTCKTVKNGKAGVEVDRVCSDKLRSFEKRLFELERKHQEDNNLACFLDDYERRINELDADFRLKLLEYVALCKSVKHSLMKRIKTHDTCECSSSFNTNQ